MENKIRNMVNKIIDTYDLGSTFNLDVVLYNGKAYYTSISINFECNECDVKDLGKEIALPIMLMGLTSPNIYGSFARNEDLNTLEEISKWKYDDIEFDLELAKLWEMLRTSCNNKELRDKIVYISYSFDTCDTWHKVLNNEEEFDYFLKEYGFVE